MQHLESALALLSGILPYASGVILHEYDSLAGRKRFRYDFSSGCEQSGWKTIPVEKSVGLERSAEWFDKMEALERAFVWRGKGAGNKVGCADGANVAAWLADGEGVGGSIRHEKAGDGNSTTMVFLRCEDELFSQKSLALLNLVLVPLHALFMDGAALIRDSISLNNLTAKEAKVLHWVVEGKTSWEVGKILSISERTVKFHLANIYSKLNVANRVQAVSVVSRGNKLGSYSQTARSA
ncbi:MAG TPA: helix-turn-helix transcriptional regulator [Paucimonas sp.]|nr:helix-turn-helix transcriptional regulator [Paucimonas sp.]